MGSDIMAPALLVPDFDTIFAIDLVIFPAWEFIKNEIRVILKDGNNENSFYREICKRTLKGPAEITQDTDEGKRWVLKFKYNGIERSLIYYHHRDYFDVWPDEIHSIGHLMTMAAPSVALAYDDDESEEDAPRALREKIVRDTTDRFQSPTFWYYALEFNHKWFPHKIALNGFKLIARIQIESLKDLFNMEF